MEICANPLGCDCVYTNPADWWNRHKDTERNPSVDTFILARINHEEFLKRLKRETTK